MIKKKEKKKFKRKNIKLQNIEIDNLEKFDEEDLVEEKRAEKKIIEKGKTSQKSNLNLKEGRIIQVESNYKCRVKIAGAELICTLSGRLKQVNYETRTLVAVGDFVNVNLAKDPRIEEILPRKNTLSRFSEENFQKEVIIASNIDQVIITASYSKPELSPGLIDRYICAAQINNILPIICVNKIDLAECREDVKKKMKFYEDTDFRVIYTSVKNDAGIDKLKEVLKNKETVFSGHSGAGKSSLINLLQPNINLEIAEISSYTGKGIHTTTSSQLIEWFFGGYLVDTPGIKTFGLHREDKAYLPLVFPGFSQYADKCKFNNCTHTHELGCAVKEAVNNDKFPVERYESYLRIFESL
jgi:ribosome biogenesis GTPase